MFLQGLLLGLPFVLLVLYLVTFAKWRIEVQHDTTGFYADHPGFHAHVLNLYLGSALRKAYLQMAPQSFSADSWSESIYEWKWAIDGFWARTIRPPLKDATRLSVETFLSPDQAKRLKDDFVSMIDRMEKLYWKEMPRSKGACGLQKDGTMCAVHRWNAYARKDRLVGRFQCWTDVSLSQWDPDFVRWYPFFHPKFMEVNDFFCLVDVPGYAGSFGAPQSLPLFHMNDLLWYHPLEVDHDVQVREGDGPVKILRREIQPFFFPMLDSFLEGGTTALDEEDEGEVIDLDLEEYDYPRRTSGITEEF